MSDFSPADIDRFRALLLELEVELQTLQNAVAVAAEPVDLDTPLGRLTRMDAIQQQKIAQANKLRARHRQQQVRAALTRMDQNRYGYCIECEEPIAKKRLGARPESPLCLECQS